MFLDHIHLVFIWDQRTQGSVHWIGSNQGVKHTIILGYFKKKREL